ncbi:MAG: ChaN family lipoprotein [Phycisphaera sp.]|nr:MAG: ChaN family lipoprotein [Phycisphaera sp.]
MQRQLLLTLIAATKMFLGGCMHTMIDPVIPHGYRDQVAQTSVKAFDGNTGKEIADYQLDQITTDADAVLFGELHGHPVGLPVAAAIWKDMLSVRDRDETPALLLEFFERDQQLAIDEYLGGMVEEEDFIKKSGRSATNFPEGHQAMFNVTKDAGGVVIAANAPRRYVRLARTEGYDHLRDLSPAQRSTFVLPRGDGPQAYRDRFIDLMGGPDMMHGESGPEDFLRSQLMWDATMADSVATALKAGHEPVALVIGRFHVEFDGATRHYLERMRPGADVLSIVMVDRWSEELAEEDKGRGDIVIYVGPADQDESDGS